MRLTEILPRAVLSYPAKIAVVCGQTQLTYADVGARVGALTSALQSFGIRPAKCVDDQLIAAAFGLDVIKTKDPTQRDACGCVVSRGIGMYESRIRGKLVPETMFDMTVATLKAGGENAR